MVPERKIHRALDEPSRQPGGHVGDKLKDQNVQMSPLALGSNTDTSITSSQRAAKVRADGILKKAGGDHKLANLKEGPPIPTNSSSADDLLKGRHFRYNFRLSPESVYNNSPGEIQIPHYTSMLDWEITGGPNMPTIYARVPTLSEIRILQRRLWRLENWVLQREDYCRVCDQTFAYGAPDVSDTPAFMVVI